jgi:hypothetical protein
LDLRTEIERLCGGLAIVSHNNKTGEASGAAYHRQRWADGGLDEWYGCPFYRRVAQWGQNDGQENWRAAQWWTPLQRLVVCERTAGEAVPSG